MPYLIMLHGKPVSGKSFAARRLSNALNRMGFKCRIIKSVLTRFSCIHKTRFSAKSVDERIPSTKKEKDFAYRKMLGIAAKAVKDGIIPILDATFHKKYRRKWVYEFCRRNKVRLIVLKLVSLNKNAIKKYLKERKKAHDYKDRIFSSWSQYKTMSGQFEEITSNEIKKNNLNIVEFDRDRKLIEIVGCEGVDKSIIESIVDVLHLPSSGNDKPCGRLVKENYIYKYVLN